MLILVLPPRSPADLLKMLDASKYSRFNLDPHAQDLNQFNPATDLNSMRLLIDYKYSMTYSDYKEVFFEFLPSFIHTIVLIITNGI